MAKFMGTVQGERGEASRLAHHELTTVAASWNGAVQTTMYEVRGAIWCRIETISWQGHGRHNLLFDGPLSAMQSATVENPAWFKGGMDGQ